MDTVITSFNQIDLQLDAAQAWYEKGQKLANLGHYQEALESFNQAVAIQPQNCAAWVFRGVVLTLLNYYEEAIVSCEKALEIQPHDKQAWICRGAALNYLGRYQQSYISYDKALGVERRSLWQTLIYSVKRVFNLSNCSNTITVTSN